MYSAILLQRPRILSAHYSSVGGMWGRGQRGMQAIVSLEATRYLLGSDFVRGKHHP
jgi:hypothetical protein